MLIGFVASCFGLYVIGCFVLFDLVEIYNSCVDLFFVVSLLVSGYLVCALCWFGVCVLGGMVDWGLVVYGFGLFACFCWI